MNNNCNMRQKLLRKVQQHGFAMLEAGLFLDGHPTCTRALQYFEKHRNTYMESVAEYEKAFGPINMKNNTCSAWNWIQGPWPWESEAN